MAEDTPEGFIQVQVLGVEQPLLFPDTMTDDQISAQLQRFRRQAPAPVDISQEPPIRDGLLSVLPESVQAGIVSTGRGITDVARGVQRFFSGDEKAEQLKIEGQLEKQQFKPLEEKFPVATTAGRIAGQTIPLLATGVGTGAAAAKFGLGLGARATLGSVAGGAEAAAIEAGSGGEVEDIGRAAALGFTIGGAAEAAVPFIGGGLRKAAEALGISSAVPNGMVRPNGELAPAFRAALDDVDVDFSELSEPTRKLLQRIPDDSNAAATVRLALADDLGVPVTRGDISLDPFQRKTEARLAESSVGQPIRELRRAQASTIENTLERTLAQTGVPDDVGTAVKRALLDRKNVVQAEVRNAYRILSEVAPDADMIVSPTGIRRAFQDNTAIIDLQDVQGGTIKGLQRVLDDYNITGAGTGNNTLSLGNFEEMRKRLNRLIDKKDDRTKAIVRPVIRALDNEIDRVTDALAGLPSGQRNMAVIEAAKNARSQARSLKQEFADNGIVEALIKTKRDGTTDFTQASHVFNKLFKPSTRSSTFEDVGAVMSSLEKAGKPGKTAIRDLQSRVVLDLIDAGFSSRSRQIAGQVLFNANAFNRRLKGYGEKELTRLFAGNKQGLKNLVKIGRLGEQISPTASEALKGSESLIFEMTRRTGLGRVPGVALILDAIGTLSSRAGDRRAVFDALTKDPKLFKAVRHIEDTLPGVARALGIPSLLMENEEDATQ